MKSHQIQSLMSRNSNYDDEAAEVEKRLQGMIRKAVTTDRKPFIDKQVKELHRKEMKPWAVRLIGVLAFVLMLIFLLGII